MSFFAEVLISLYSCFHEPALLLGFCSEKVLPPAWALKIEFRHIIVLGKHHSKSSAKQIGDKAMQVSRYLMKKLWLLIFFVFIASAFSGCTVKFVADYDSVTFEEILKVAKDVDRFYGVLLEAKSDDRAYQKYSSQYVEIESDIRSLVTRNKARALNEESTQISEIILKLWCKYKKSHAEKNAYSDKKAELDRNRFTRLFESAASAEKAKILKPDDKDPSKESA